MRLLFALGLLQRGELAFGQHQAFLSDLGFERLDMTVKAMAMAMERVPRVEV
jgi:hypothetical protein